MVARISGLGVPSGPKCGAKRPSDRAKARKSRTEPSGVLAQSSLIAGLPYLRISPAHGTAFEIAGKGVASAASLVSALLQAASWAELEHVSSTNP